MLTNSGEFATTLRDVNQCPVETVYKCRLETRDDSGGDS